MENKLSILRSRIEGGNWEHVNRPLFSGADLIIEESFSSKWPGKTIVSTDHKNAKELSALVYELKQIFAGKLDYLNKYYFYPELGKAANEYLAKGNDTKGLLLSVVERANIIEKEWSGRLYFAYGSNMDKTQMAARCPDSTMVGLGRLEDYSFGVDKAGYATVESNPGKFVEGSVWQLTEEDEEVLDHCEGVNLGCYRKEYINVRYNSYEIPMLVYISNREKSDVSENKNYMRKVINGAKALHLSEGYVKTIESFAC